MAATAENQRAKAGDESDAEPIPYSKHATRPAT